MSAACDPCAPAIDCPSETDEDFSLYSLTSNQPYAAVVPVVGVPCSGCGASIDCSGGLNNPDSSSYSYSLTSDPPLPFFFRCPPGYSCQPTGPSTVYMTCCSHTLSRSVDSTTTDAQLSALVQSMMTECQQYAGECSDPPTIGGGPTGPVPGPGPSSPSGPGGGGSPTNIFYNEPLVCQAKCADGSVIPSTIRAGIAIGTTQAAANAPALGLCGQLALQDLICMGKIASTGCLNTEYDEILSVTIGSGVKTPLVFSGSGFPPGISVTSAAPAFPNYASVYAASLTTAGNYTGSITVTDANGLSATKTFPISVLGITNAGSLPDASATVPYSQQLTAAGGTGPYTFSADPDMLPDWVSVSGSGLITGTPSNSDTGIDFSFEVAVTDSKGQSCSATVDITVAGFANAAVNVPVPCISSATSVSVPVPAGAFSLPPGTPYGQSIVDAQAYDSGVNAQANQWNASGACACYTSNITQGMLADGSDTTFIMKCAQSVTFFKVNYVGDTTTNNFLASFSLAAGQLFSLTSLAVGNHGDIIRLQLQNNVPVLGYVVHP